MNQVCLNCSQPLQGNYCIHCGQSAKSHRFTLKHVFSHDFLHAIFHFDKGLFFSVKELFTRPGHTTREYINGKRVSHINYFSMLVLLIMAFSLVEDITPFHYTDLGDGQEDILKAIDSMLREHPKFIFLAIIPFEAAISYLIFRKAEQNYSENFILNSFKTSATIILNILFLLLVSVIHDISTERALNKVMVWIVTGYGIWFYYQYFSPFYGSKFVLFMKSLLCTLLPVLLFSLGLALYLILVGSAKLE